MKQKLFMSILVIFFYYVIVGSRALAIRIRRASLPISHATSYTARITRVFAFFLQSQTKPFDNGPMVLFLETVTNLIGDILDRDIRWNAHTYPQSQLSSRMSTAVKTRFKVESVTNCHENPGNLPNTSRLTLLISRTIIIIIIITVQPPCAYIIAPSRKKSQSWWFAVHHFHGSAANERSTWWWKQFALHLPWLQT